MEILNQAAAGITIALGSVGLIAPQFVARFVSIRAVGLMGKSEIRATYGGFFLALGTACLIWGTPELYRALGFGWLGASGGRLISIIVDRSVSKQNLGAVCFEAAMGAAFLA